MKRSCYLTTKIILFTAMWKLSSIKTQSTIIFELKNCQNIEKFYKSVDIHEVTNGGNLYMLFFLNNIALIIIIGILKDHHNKKYGRIKNNIRDIGK